jgi:LPXTG-motif cell wall-anchored protein
MTRALIRVVLSAALVCVTAAVTLAQQTGTTTETKKFQIIAVEGNQLVVKLPEGTRELTVPDDFRFNIDGKMLSVHELKPGMTGTATITTRTTVTPVTVTEVKNGTVAHTSGGSIIVRTDEGFKSFTQGDIDKRGVRIMRHGKPAQISDFRVNDQLTATIITSKPPQVLTEKEVQATLAGSGLPSGTPPGAARPAPKPTAPTPTAAAPSPTGTTAPAAAPKKLPKTASPLPVLGLVGLASLVAGLGLTARRRRSTR